ncbi:23S rRNA (guanosine(2251)-2'-O)-methyltransferase RlmB [Vagococcus zengguangii]|uniref:23S rRNA (Guanosine(2251)-2'-O)-methyltransferase RlmB n=1 Tax=Vagococcus zengguangii TaxID=2571750 RepID=A0A4D7CV63_9ENTE|nr:23S rRNA (guanosine(2251)-2'-O)-methyltransferase RlmB [Vagococcus zengguangii]QCI87254.1 23S rRNA (guanosine(2251)-2'-O)-methyltransferase RlmB [Vagococcus zengguangii]TLG80758.1 23S rRNA (guanosine(2251)-2'-O)-methyltransferase RlmB [Vagococcus zengguangii]
MKKQTNQRRSSKRSNDSDSKESKGRKFDKKPGAKKDFKEPNRRGRENSRHEAPRKEQPEETPTTNAEDFAIGFYGVSEALEAKRGNKLFVQEDLSGRRIDDVKKLATKHSVPMQFAPKSKLDLLSDHGNHQGVVLGVTPYEYLTIEGLLEQTTSEAPFYLILDSIEDPHNFGSILRTADATGVDGVIIPKHRAVGITSVVSKTSTGAVEHVPVARVTNLAQAIRTLKDKQFWVYGTDMNGTDYRHWNVAGPTALIIGNEGKGISPGLKKEVDEMLTIPMTGHVQSLNASVAAGVMMYEVFRKRH